MTLADIKNRIYFYTNTDATSFTAANMLIAVNNALDEVHSAILRSQDNWRIDDTTNADFPIAYADLVSGQADYTLPTGILRIHSVEIKYGGKWYKAVSINENETGKSLEDFDFAADAPYYSIIGNSIIIRPTPTADGTEALKVVYDRNFTLFTADQLTAGTVSPGFDRNFHDIIPLKCSLDWAVANTSPKVGSLKPLLDELMMKLKAHYADKSRDSKVAMTPSYFNVE
jgi:hypothetical protein